MRKLLMAGSALSLVVCATPVFAQADEQQAESDGDIVVTATRSESLLSKTPIAR